MKHVILSTERKRWNMSSYQQKERDGTCLLITRKKVMEHACIPIKQKERDETIFNLQKKMRDGTFFSNE